MSLSLRSSTYRSMVAVRSIGLTRPRTANKRDRAIRASASRATSSQSDVSDSGGGVCWRTDSLRRCWRQMRTATAMMNALSDVGVRSLRSLWKTIRKTSCAKSSTSAELPRVRLNKRTTIGACRRHSREAACGSPVSIAPTSLASSSSSSSRFDIRSRVVCVHQLLGASPARAAVRRVMQRIGHARTTLLTKSALRDG